MDVYSSHHLTSFMMIIAYFLTTVNSNIVGFFLLYIENSTVVMDIYCCTNVGTKNVTT